MKRVRRQNAAPVVVVGAVVEAVDTAADAAVAVDAVVVAGAVAVAIAATVAIAGKRALRT